jgi:hypothetical protein
MSEIALIYAVIHIPFFFISGVVSMVYEALEPTYTVLIIHFGELPTETTIYISENISDDELSYLIETLGENETIC